MASDSMADVLKRKLLEQVKKKEFYQQLLKEKELTDEKYNKLLEQINLNDEIVNYFWFAKPGHFYSPLVDEEDGPFDGLVNLNDEIKLTEVSLPGIDLQSKEQLKLLSTIAKNYEDFKEYRKRKDIRFDFKNNQFGDADASFLFLMLRHIKPRRIIEVGSGWTSSLMLDVNELYPKDAANLTFIDPNPERLYTALHKGDKKKTKIITEKVQTLSPSSFDKLEAGDLLFIDDSHVSKFGSDVNYMFFDVLPRIKKDVYIHIHDIPYPFEYSYQWVVEDKRNWNEAYIVRAMLTDSTKYKILIWSSYLKAAHKEALKREIPSATGIGTSFWLKKTG